MPDGISPDEGITALLDYVLRADIPGVYPWQLMLWVNNYTPVAGTTLANLTEASFAGYARASLPREDWTPAVATAGCCSSEFGTSPIQWVCTGGPFETVYGYALVDATANKLRYVQRFDANDIRPVALGFPLTLRPRITLTSAPC
jgi:hypothetical protein